LGEYDDTGAVVRNPSSPLLCVGKVPCQMLHIHRPRGVSSSPHAKRARSRPPRAAYSHWASLGSRFPAQAAYASASYQETWTTGWFCRRETSVPGPSGARQLAPRTVALTALMDSPVSDAADEVVDLSFADERAVVQTRFATTALSLLRALVHPESAEPAAADAERALVEPLPVDVAGVEQWTFLGRGWTVGLAHEAALKLRETAQAWTEAYPAFEYRHGPVAIAAPGRVVWSFGPLHPDIAEQIGATGATVLAPELDPLASLVLAQRAAVALAESRGLDPDEPRNLTRSIVLSDGELDLLSPRGA